YAGDEVIAVACDTEEHAADAIRAIKVVYEEMDALVTEEDALKKDLKTVQGVGQTRDKSNVKVVREDKSNDIDAAFGKADVGHEGQYGAATINHHCLEPHGLVAEWDKDGNLTVWCSTQAVAGITGQLAGKLLVPVAKIKCITHYMGGGYGSK